MCKHIIFRLTLNILPINYCLYYHYVHIKKINNFKPSTKSETDIILCNNNNNNAISTLILLLLAHYQLNINFIITITYILKLLNKDQHKIKEREWRQDID